MVGEVLGGIESLIGMFTQQGQTKEEKAQLDELARQNKVASGVWRGENILAEQGNQGLAGYEGMREEVKSELPTTLNQFKDSVAAGSLVDMLGNFQARQDKSLRSLSQQNSQAQTANRQKYAEYLGNTVGGAQQNQMN